MNCTKLWWFAKTILVKHRYGKIGKHSYLAKPIFIQRKKNVFIGKNVRIYPGMRAELTNKTAKIEIKNNVSIGQNFHIVSSDGVLRIAENTTISGNVFISNTDHNYSELSVHILEQDMIKRETRIGENCFIGYGAVLLPGTILGNQCIVGANSVVRGVFDDYCVIAGNPAKVIKKYNKQKGIWEKVKGE